jgi:hypothetical protein
MSRRYIFTGDSKLFTYWDDNKLVFEAALEGERRVLAHLVKAICGLNLSDLNSRIPRCEGPEFNDEQSVSFGVDEVR